MRPETDYHGQKMESKGSVKDGIPQTNIKMRLPWRREECQSPLSSQQRGVVLETWAQLVADMGSASYWRSIFAARLPASCL